MSKAGESSQQGALETVEEAIALLREAPAGLLLLPFLGGVPFWLGFLLFVSEMSRSAFAAERLAGSALALAILYLWKKGWEVAFGSGLLRLLQQQPAEKLTSGRVVRLLARQAAVQYWGFPIRLLAYSILLPSAWVSAFYQNAVILGDSGELRETLSSRAWAQAKLWPLQSNLILSVLSFFTMLVWLNVLTLMAAAPFLLNILFGVESMASRSPISYFLNSTFWFATVAVALLLANPLWRATYAVRCFHGLAITTGADVIARLSLLRKSRSALLLFVLVFSCAGVRLVEAQEVRASEPATSSAATQEAKVLDEKVTEVLKRREFAWRQPRQLQPKAKQKGWLFNALSWFKINSKKLMDWLSDRFNRRDKPPSSGTTWSIPRFDSALWIVGGIALAVVGFALWRSWSRRKPKAAIVEAVAVMPDLEAADVAVEQLPEEGWLALARELAGKGELRLALRAAYLAGLSYLGGKDLVSIARHKSNRDYQRELRRRARSRGELLELFSLNLGTFERTWYGMHAVPAGTFEEFCRNLERMRQC